MAAGKIQALASAAPINEDKANVEWGVFEEGLHAAGFKRGSAIAATCCSFGEANIEALIDAPQLAVILPDGIYSSMGKRKMFGKTPGVRHDRLPSGQGVRRS